MYRRIVAVASAILMAATMTACRAGNAANNNGGNISGKAYTQQAFDGASVQNGMNPVVNSAGELVTASQQSGQPAVVTTWDVNGKQKSALTSDVTDTASQLALGAKDEIYLLATPQSGRPTVHVLDASGKTTKTIELAGLQPQGMMQASSDSQSSGSTSNSNGNGTTNVRAVAAGNRPTTLIGMQVAPDGGVIVSALGAGVVQFDPSGKQVRTYDQAGGMINYLTMNDRNQLIVYSMGGSAPSLTTYGTSDGKQISSLDTPAMSSVQSMFYDKAGKRLLYMTGSDVQALSPDGKTSTVLATFSDFSLNDGFRQLIGFTTDKNGTIYLTASNSNASPQNGSAAAPGTGASTSKGGNLGGPVALGLGSGINEMIRLGLVDVSALKARTTITVAAINGSQVLNQVISAFQKAYPDYKINLKVYNTTAVGMQTFVGPNTKMVTKQAGGNQPDLSSYIQALNTDLMSGSGADVIVLDDLPWYKYVDKGILTDLGKLMSDKHFDTSPYYTNIFDGCKVGGKIYGVPASFSYTLLTGKAAYMPDSANPTLAEFMAKAKALPSGVTPFGNQDASSIFEGYIRFCYPELVDTTNHTAHFNSPEFIQAMKDFKDLIGQNTSANTKQDAMAEQLNGDVAYNTASMATPMDLAMQRAILGDDMKVSNVPTISGSNAGLFTASLLLGINANSKNQDAAWNFIKTMLGADIQGNQTEPDEGYPVLKSAAQKKIDDMKTGSVLGKMRMVLRVGDKQVEAKPLTDADYQSVLNTLPALNMLQAADPNVLNILNEELPTFFTGQKTAEDVAALIQNRVSTLLNE